MSNTTDTATHPAMTPAVSVEDARKRALNAEEKRVEAVLANQSNITESVGVYGETNATVVKQTETGVQVRVTMSYSYEYNCKNENGVVDGQTTTSLYTVTADNVQLDTVTKGVRTICN